MSAWNWWPLPMANPDTAKDSIQYLLSLSAASSSGTYAPFWLQTNRNGNIAPAPHSGNLTAGIFKAPTRPNRWYDYDFGVVLTGRLQSRMSSVPDERIGGIGTGYANLLYAHVRLYIVDVTVGIKPLQFGTADEQLTSGGLIFSNNAHPMPRVSIGIDKWTAIPGLFGYAEIRGGIDHLWQNDDAYITRGLVHHKYIGGRIGGKLPVNFSYEFHHVAQWGGYSPQYGDLGNDLHSFMTIFKAKSGGTMSNDKLNAQGNHIGSQTMTLDVKGKDWKVSAYWNSMFEDGPIKFMTAAMNLPDGLWGVNIQQSKWPFIQSLTYEFLNTTDQSGPFHDKDGYIFGGVDNYYTNSVYSNGWNYFYRTIGTPFITSPLYNTDGSIATTNNRVMAHYIGLRGDIFGFRYRLICSYAKNYGQYATNPYSQLLSTNTSLLLEVNKHVEKAWGLDFGLSLGSDIGNQFGNTFGAMLTIRKQGLLTCY